jgi:hypothetical protein
LISEQDTNSQNATKKSLNKLSGEKVDPQSYDIMMNMFKNENFLQFINNINAIKTFIADD